MLEVKKFPTDLSLIDVDTKEPKRCLVDGLFEESVDVNGEERTFYTYIKPGLLYNQSCLVIAVPDDVDTLEYIEKSPWLKFADKFDVFLHFLIPSKGGWNLEGKDADYMNRTYVQINGRRSYVVMQDKIYAIGIGNGANVAQQAVMKMMSEWSGLATFGDLSEKALLNTATTGGSQKCGKTELVISASRVQVPVWMTFSSLAGANEKTVSFWKEMNDCEEESYSNKWADLIYFPSTVVKKSQINEEKISQVRVTFKASAEVCEETLEAIWAFLSKACRHRGFGTKMLRNRIDPDIYGFTKHEIEMDGFTRLWYEYVPERVRTLGRPVPLVVCMHGRGGTAESFISLSGMSRVAEERDFIVVFPEASVYQQKSGTLRNLLLWNGCYKGKPIDDVPFILEVVRQAKERYNIDSSRIYACGQSSGGMMTSALAQKVPDLFAAVAPWSALVNPDAPELVLPDKIEPAVPFFFLFGETDWLCADKENGELEYHAAKDIAAFLKNLIKIYALDEKPHRYTCGEISYYVYLNKKRVPMLTVGTVRDMSHANYPGESWASYDQFLSKFSKSEDGTLLYMGEKAT